MKTRSRVKATVFWEHLFHKLRGISFHFALYVEDRIAANDVLELDKAVSQAVTSSLVVDFYVRI